MPRHRLPKAELPDHPAAKRLVEELVEEGREANMGTDAFEEHLARVLTQAANEIAAEAKARPSRRVEPKPRRKR